MEEKEYESAVLAYLDDIYRLACSITGNEADAADISQVVFIRLTKTEKEFETSRHLKNWLLKCTANESRSLLRSFWRKNVFSQEDWMEPEVKPQDPILLYLRDLIQGLSKTDRAILLLYYWQDYDQKEIGSFLNMSPGAVSMRLLRIRKKLKTKLTEGKQTMNKNENQIIPDEIQSIDSCFEALNTIQVPSSLRKEILMKNEFTNKQKKRTGKMIAAGLLAAAIIVPAADGLVYAATGTGVIHTIIIRINGENEKLDLQEYKNEDGTKYYSGQLKNDDGSEYSLTIEDPETQNDLQLSIDDDKTEMTLEGDGSGSVSYTDNEVSSEAEDKK